MRNVRNKILTVSISLLLLFLASCDDTTNSLGSDMMPSQDFVHSSEAVYYAVSQTVPAGDVLARSSISYLGRFTDPETGTSIKSDFLAQFHCPEHFAMPDSIVNDSVTAVDLRLYVKDFVGDSLQTLKISVYPLDSVLNPDLNYYTNIIPENYYDSKKEPIAEKWFTLSDYTISDSERWSSEHYNNIYIPLPRYIGQAIYDGYKSHPEYFTNSEAFIRSGIPGTKGFYFKLEAGDGAMAYIDISSLTIHFDAYVASEDSVYKDAYKAFGSTEEVIQATRFENSNLQKLIDDQSATYLKSPAGLFTQITLPIDEIMSSQYSNDSINSVKLTLTRYNDRVQSRFKLSIPKNVLLVRYDDYTGYFENYKVADDLTSYVATYNKKSNTYDFSNISNLVSTMITEKKNGRATPNYNKVYIIPVEPTYDTSSYLVKLCHDFSMSSTRLLGGTDKIKLDVVYTNYRR